ncbi:MAG: right-handed parallel beta-helix repeat-containing protein [Myxococcales bacterium]|nr:right-handed parallel beta-helix repeat-containing protein [Myxococcota bacterium]MDW8281743.1 right-handed parallel beta-helix repeat-containing protein [Myxococcales bacterium]
MRTVSLIGPRWLLVAGLLGLGGCDSLWGSFRGPNDQNCLHNPALCTEQQLCSPKTRQCEDKCMSSAECTRDPSKPVCLNGLCQACDEIANKNEADKQCQERGVSGSNVCVRSGPNKGQCLGCDTVADCRDDGSVCAPNNQCMLMPCATHKDCRSGVCDPYQMVLGEPGRCVPQSELIYVDNRDGPCTSGDGSSPQGALCTLDEGVRKAVMMKRALRVVGREASYGPLKLETDGSRFTGQLVIYGPAGTPALEGERSQARLGGNPNVPGVDLVAGGGAQLTLDGLAVHGAERGAWCEVGGGQSALLTLRRLVIRDASFVGVEVSGCQLVMDRVMITGSRGGGLRLLSSNYSITNSILFKNRSGTNSTVFIDNNSQGVFRFNTVVHNEVSEGGGRFSGISCGNSQLIEDTIVVGNRGSPSQLSGCRLARTVVGRMEPGDLEGAIKEDPSFEDPSRGDFQLKPDASCCIDRAMADPRVRTDYFGTRRPQRGGYDIGAHELP